MVRTGHPVQRGTDGLHEAQRANLTRFRGFHLDAT